MENIKQLEKRTEALEKETLDLISNLLGEKNLPSKQVKSILGPGISMAMNTNRGYSGFCEGSKVEE